MTGCPMHWLAWTRQVAASELRPEDRGTALALLEWAAADSLRLYAAVSTVAAATGRSRRFAGLSLRRLEAAGMIRVLGGGWSGGGRPNVIELVIAPEHAIEPAPPAAATAHTVRTEDTPTAHAVRSSSEATAHGVRSSGPATAHRVRSSGGNCAPGAHEPMVVVDTTTPQPPTGEDPTVADAMAALERLDVRGGSRRFLVGAHSPARILAWCRYAEAEAAAGRSHKPAGLAVSGIRSGDDPPGARQAAEAAARARRRAEAIDQAAEERRRRAEAWAAEAAKGPGRMPLAGGDDDDDESGVSRFARRLAAARAARSTTTTESEATACSG